VNCINLGESSVRSPPENFSAVYCIVSLSPHKLQSEAAVELVGTELGIGHNRSGSKCTMPAWKNRRETDDDDVFVTCDKPRRPCSLRTKRRYDILV